MNDLSAATEYILSLFKESTTKQITGTQLRYLLGYKYPDFEPRNHECATLREFLIKFVPGIAEIGRNGSECVYGLRSDSKVSDSAQNRAVHQPQFDIYKQDEGSIWKTFASPQNIYQLFGNTNTGKLVVMKSGCKPPSGEWRMIPSCNTETHIKIATEFISEVSMQAIREKLTQCIGQPRWWDTFYLMLGQYGLQEKWNLFRRKRILEEMKETLQKEGVPIGGMPRSLQTQIPVGTSKSNPVSPETELEMLRRIAITLINSMSVSELKEIRVPIGDVIAAFNERQK